MRNMVARGTLYLIGAQLAIVVSGYLIHIILARLFGPAMYGTFGIILSLFMINKVVFLSGPVKAVSKYVSADKEKAESILRAGMYLQIILIAICLIFYLFFSKNVALFFNDPALENLILLSSLIILPVGIYALLVRGYLNVLKLFKYQSLLEVLHSFLRLIIAVLLVYFGFNVFGAVAAYIIAPFFVFLISYRYIKVKKHKGEFSKLKLLKFGINITLFYIIITIVLELGLLSVKIFLENNDLTGFYTSAASIAKIPYSLFTALPLIMLPSISSALAHGNIKLVHKYIQSSLRYLIILLFPITVLISAYSSEIINLFYSSIFSSAGPILKILIFGFTFFTLFTTICSFMFGADSSKIVVYLVFIVLAVALLLNLKLIPLWGLQGAALATTFTALFAFVLASVYLFLKFGIFFNLISTLRITFSSAVIYLLASIFPVSGLLFIIFIILFLILYFLILCLTREIDQKDLAFIFSVFGLKK